MFELGEKEIEMISFDIERQGLTYTLLKDELLDHICCSIEEEMAKGLTFNDSYRKVKKQMGPKRIRQIQDETLYLVNKKYRRMKKLTYGLGIAIPIVFMLGVVFKLMHWPGGGPLFTLGLILLALIFLPVFAMLKIRGTRTQNEPVPLAFYLTGMIAAILAIVGVLFKIQHLPGAAVLLGVGLGTLGLVFLPMFAVLKKREALQKNEPFNSTFHVLRILAGALFIAGALFKILHWPGAAVIMISSWIAAAVFLLPFPILNILKKEENRLGNFTLVIFLFTAVSVLILVQMTRSSQRMIIGLVISEAAMTEDAVYLQKKSDELAEASIPDPELQYKMERLRSEADALSTFILDLQVDLAIRGRSARVPDAGSGRVLFTEVAGLDVVRHSTNLMFGRDDDPTNSDQLYTMLGSFRETALSITKDPLKVSLIEARLNLENPEFWYETWAEMYFSGTLMQTANHLSMFRSAVSLIEYEILKELLGKV